MIRQVRATLPQVTSVAEARALGRVLRREWPAQRIRRLVTGIGEKAERSSSIGWGRVERLRIAADRRQDAEDSDGRKLAAKWANEAASQIKSVRDEVAAGLAAEVVQALEAGTDPATLAERWRGKGIPLEFGTLEGRVKVIAQHQLGMLHAEVQRTRAEAVGVRDFIWRTQGDDAVRDEHRDLDGTRSPARVNST